MCRRPQSLANRVSIKTRNHHIQRDGFELGRLRGVQRLLAGGHQVCGDPLFQQSLAQDLAQADIVFDDKHAHAGIFLTSARSRQRKRARHRLHQRHYVRGAYA